MTHPTHPRIPRPGSRLQAPGKDLTFLSTLDGRLRFREDIGPDAPPVPLHVHLTQTERFFVIEGSLLVTLNGKVIRLQSGDSIEVPPGQVHTYALEAAGSAVIEVELWPHRQDHQFFETIYGLTREGRLPPSGPRDVLAFLALCHRHGFLIAGLPRGVLRPVAALAAGLAAILRIDPWVPSYAAVLGSMSDGSPMQLSPELEVAP